MIDCVLEDAFGVLFCQVWSAGLQCSARRLPHLKPLNRVVSGASFPAGGVFECDIAHRRSVAGIIYAAQDQVQPNAPSLCFFT